MQFKALVPALLCVVSLVLSFLCLFAGSSNHYMNDFAIFTVNTSRIGYEEAFSTSTTGECDNALSCTLRNATESLVSLLQSAFEKRQSGDGDDDGDCTDPIDCLVSNATATVNNVTSSIGEGIGNVTQGIGEGIGNVTEGIGEGIANVTEGIGSGISNITDGIGSAINNATGEIDNVMSELLQAAANSMAKLLGIRDFYSGYLMNYCEGYYEPSALPNATLSKSDISQNFTFCSQPEAMYWFDPMEIIQTQLDQDGLNLNLTDLDWPKQITDSLNQLKVAQQAAFVIYCITIALLFIAIGAALAAIFIGGRILALVNLMLTSTAWLASMFASAIVTAIAVKGAGQINDYGNAVGISATQGSSLLGLTWGATVALLIACLAWVVDFVMGRRAARPEPATKSG